MRQVLQALEAGCCDALAQLTASEDPEEKTAASKAITVLLKGMTCRPAVVPGLGYQAASASATTRFAVPADSVGGHADAIKAASRYQAGGGMPTSSLFPLVQLIAMSDMNDPTVDVTATLHALKMATESLESRQAMLECAAPLLVMCICKGSAAITSVSVSCSAGLSNACRHESLYPTECQHLYILKLMSSVHDTVCLAAGLTRSCEQT